MIVVLGYLLSNSSSIGAEDSNAAGFTMIELMIVLTIAAILVAVAGPPLSNMVQNNRLQSASQVLMSSIRLARTEAIARNRITHLELDNNNQISICIVDAIGDACPATTDEDFIKSLTLGSDTIQFASNTDLAAGIDFTTRGRLAQAGNVSIGVCDDRGAAYGRFVQVSQVGRSLQRKINAGSGDSCTP